MALESGSGNQETRVNKQIVLFDDSEFARLLGMRVIEAGDGFAKVAMDCRGKKNPHGVAHGGAIFALADQAFGIAANCGETDRVAVSVHIQYIAPASGPLVAIASRIADNGRYSTFRVLVREGDRIIAEFDGVAMSVDRADR
jgi:acyl-CoA thioesterase